jgi:hypothetical protein
VGWENGGVVWIPGKHELYLFAFACVCKYCLSTFSVEGCNTGTFLLHTLLDLSPQRLFNLILDKDVGPVILSHLWPQ